GRSIEPPFRSRNSFPDSRFSMSAQLFKRAFASNTLESLRWSCLGAIGTALFIVSATSAVLAQPENEPTVAALTAQGLKHERSKSSDRLSPGVDESAKVVSLEVVPKNLVLTGSNASHRILLMAKFVDGLDRDVTSKGRIWISDPTLARVDNEGVLRAL